MEGRDVVGWRHLNNLRSVLVMFYGFTSLVDVIAEVLKEVFNHPSLN